MIGRQTFERKHGTAERWDTCDCDDCLAGLDAAGIPVPAHMAGHSILPLLGGRSVPDWPEEVFAQISESQTGRCVRTHRWKYSVVRPEKDEQGAFVSQAHSEVYEDQFLYDLLADPWELKNLIGLTTHKPVVNVMRQRLIRHMAAIGEPSFQFVDAPPRAPFQERVTPDEYQQ